MRTQILKTKNLIKKYPYHSIVIVALAIIFLIFLFNRGDAETAQTAEREIRTVQIASVADYATGALGSFSPTAGGGSFVVRAESGGLVKGTATEGEVIAKGTVLAELENSSQRAALTQAQGSYEAALAAAAKSEVGAEASAESLASTQNSAKNTYRSAFVTTDSVMRTTLDPMFNDYNRAVLGLQDYVQEKRQIRYDLEDWAELSTGNIDNNDLYNYLQDGESVINDMVILIDKIYEDITRKERNTSDSQESVLAIISTYKTQLSSARASLSSAKASLNTATSQLESAQSSYEQARLSASGAGVSAADANVKQALGSLQAAQASYEKTIVKAPFAGTVLSLNVKVGDIINTGADIAIVKPESGENTEKSFELPLSAVKFTPSGANVFTVNSEGELASIAIETGLVTTSRITVTGLVGDEMIVEDVRGLKAGEQVNVK